MSESPFPAETKVRVYVYDRCTTCRDALKFLKAQSIPHEAVPIREQPPTIPELRQVLAAAGGNLRKIFNTSGNDYKALGLKDRLPGMAEEEALRLLMRPQEIPGTGRKWPEVL